MWYILWIIDFFIVAPYDLLIRFIRNKFKDPRYGDSSQEEQDE